MTDEEIEIVIRMQHAHIGKYGIDHTIDNVADDYFEAMRGMDRHMRTLSTDECQKFINRVTRIERGLKLEKVLK